MQGSKKIHFVIIRVVPRLIDHSTLSQGTNQLFTGHSLCPVFGYHFSRAIFLAHSLLRSPRSGWMGCSRTDPQLSATCCGTKSPLGHGDNWTCVSSSSSLLEPPRRHAALPCSPPAGAERFWLLNYAAGEKGSCWLLSSFALRPNSPLFL